MSLGKLWGSGEVDRDTNQDITSLSVFLECDLKQAHPLILRLALEADRPDWLKGVNQLNHLPRFRFLNEVEMPFLYAVDETDERTEIVRWVVEELKHEWCLSMLSIHFASDYDAVLYRLRWG